MESSQELQHWGIKGQKWGVRRYQNEDGTLTEAGKKRYYYQNPDGSLTEEGKKNYMKAARKGKLDYKKLSDNDLNMINSRFARENTYKQNVQKYEDSLFSTKLKNAIIDRLKGNGGGGGGGKGKGGGGGGFGIGKLLAMPIKAAFEDAMKSTSKGGGGGDEATDADSKWWREKEEHGRRFVSKYVPDIKDEKSVRKAYREKDVKRKHESSDSGTRFGVGKSVGSTGYTDTTRTGTDYLAKRLAESKAKKEADYIDRRREEKRRKKESAARRRELDLEERMKKSGLILGHNAFVIVRGSGDELYHHGIKGQRWGVRRYQNEDGTLTEAGRQRYMYDFGSGRKMSLVGKLKFSKDVRQKTEADEANKHRKTMEFISKMDERSEQMNKMMKNYDKLDDAAKKKFGNDLLDEIEMCDNYFSKPENWGSEKTAEYASVANHQDRINDWIYDQVKKKSGRSWLNESVSEGHRKMLDEYNKAYQSGDPKRKYDAGHKLVSTGLRDIGFEDTKKNRKRCWHYFFDDYYPWRD